MHIHIHISSDGVLEASGLAVACISIQAASTCVLAVQLILPSKLQFVQISDHGELCPGYREGTDYALEVGKVSTSAVTYTFLKLKKKNRALSVLNN